jgi:hypothetical protein
MHPVPQAPAGAVGPATHGVPLQSWMRWHVSVVVGQAVVGVGQSITDVSTIDEVLLRMHASRYSHGP